MLIARYSDGSPVIKGDSFVDFRGDMWEFVMASRPTIPGKSGKVIVRCLESGKSWENAEFYVNVFPSLSKVDFVSSPCGHEVCDGFGRENELCRFTDGKFGGKIS